MGTKTLYKRVEHVEDADLKMLAHGLFNGDLYGFSFAGLDRLSCLSKRELDDDDNDDNKRW